jgi:spore coat polysaccharide biosynthesis protein SpsF
VKKAGESLLGGKRTMILAVLQARFSSSRLPGKVLRPIFGVPLILLQIERILRCREIDHLVLATSLDPSDDQIEQVCKEHSIDCFRGSLDDVLDRYYRVAEKFPTTHVVRLTGDCPLTDPEVVDRVIRHHLDGGFDYTSNVTEPTFPDGLDVEIMQLSALKKAWAEARLASQREHVTLFINRQPDLFKIGVVKNDTDLSYLRWTVDEPLDFELVKNIYESLYLTNSCFATADILKLLEANPELKTMNTGYIRNEGLLKSLAQDREVK